MGGRVRKDVFHFVMRDDMFYIENPKPICIFIASISSFVKIRNRATILIG